MPQIYEPFVSPSTNRPTFADLAAVWPSSEPSEFVDADRSLFGPERELLAVQRFYIVRPDGPLSDHLEIDLTVVESVDDIDDCWRGEDEQLRISQPELIRVEGTIGYHTGGEISELADLAMAVLGALLPGATCLDADGECHALDGRLEEEISVSNARAERAPPARKSFWARLFGGG
jgi:hypothetical protein